MWATKSGLTRLCGNDSGYHTSSVQSRVQVLYVRADQQKTIFFPEFLLAKFMLGQNWHHTTARKTYLVCFNYNYVYFYLSVFWWVRNEVLFSSSHKRATRIFQKILHTIEDHCCSSLSFSKLLSSLSATAFVIIERSEK